MDNELPLFLRCQLPLMSYRSVFYSYVHKGLVLLSHPLPLSLSLCCVAVRIQDNLSFISMLTERRNLNRLYAHHATQFNVHARFVTRIRSLLHPKQSLIGLGDL